MPLKSILYMNIAVIIRLATAQDIDLLVVLENGISMMS
ncbi:acetyltransferase acetyltransferase [Shewanella putrefaciens]|nr:acetyltransferase acetyltransferase [Shewanella putrefaciens]